MRPSRTTLFLVAACLIAVPQMALAEDSVEAQMRAMQERMSQLETRLDATTDELEHANQRVEEQTRLIETSGIAAGSSSGLASFLETLEIGGWVAGSYLYNFNDPDGALNGGANSGTGAVASYPFHPDANSFSVDQLWFELEKPVSEDSRAGFRADLLYGKTAGILSGDFGTGDGFSGNDFDMYQAYVQYLAPIGSGITVKAGKFATIIGAEVAQSPYNFNITRGHVYNLFQPFTHTGILASGEANGASVAFGVVNETRSFPGADIDLNKDLAMLASVGLSGETVSASLNAAYGSADSGQTFNTRSTDKEIILDLLLGWDPSDSFSAYINADYIDSENSRSLASRNGILAGMMPAGTPLTATSFTGEFDGYGIAAAGRYAINDRMGLALRGEWVDLEFDQFSGSQDLEIWGVTGTMDYSLTENLMLRGEVRYDNVASSDPAFDNSFFEEANALGDDEDDQIVAGVEVIYSF